MIPLRQHAPFAILLLAALGLLGMAFFLARQTQTVRLARSQEPLRRFSGELQHELHRLERTYEAHLSRLARSALASDRAATWQACDRVIGIQQFSLLHRAAERTLDVHIPIALQPVRQPSFGPEEGELPGRSWRLPEKELLQSEETSGWLEEPGQPLFYWQRRGPDECVVLLIDAAAVASAIETWLAPWLETNFAPLRAAGGPDRLSGPGVASLAEVGAP